MSKKREPLHPDAPLLHPDHPRPVTRREFLRQGFLTGGAMVTGPALLNLFLHPEEAHALATDLQNTTDIGTSCLSSTAGGTIPFICFDLSGGANLASSNVLVGKQGGQLDLLSATGYSRMGVPSTRLPGMNDPNLRGNRDYTDSRLGLKFHSESAMLAGIMDRLTAAHALKVNGAVMPAVSNNDTGTNPHNPLYGIAKLGAKGSVATLIGSQNSDSGGNSVAPTMFMDPTLRPTKVSQPSDVTGLVDTGNLTAVLSQADAVRVMESIARISKNKVAGINTGLGADETRIKQLTNCGYVKAADIAERFGSPESINPATDPDIVGPTGIFTTAEFNADAEFRKTAAVMKMVVNSLAGAGCITMGGYDYHTGDRITGELRDLRAGRCIGACLEYAARRGIPLMVYVFSDGSVFSNGSMDNTAVNNGAVSLPGGKGVWTGDSSTTACSFFLVYNPTTQPVLTSPVNQQLGWFRADGSVETNSTPGANNVNQLVQMVWLNYLALNNMTGQFNTLVPGHGLGTTATELDALIAFQPL